MIIGYDASRAFSTSRTGTENYAFRILSHLAQIDHKNIYYVYLRPNSSVIAIPPWREKQSSSKSNCSEIASSSFDKLGTPRNDEDWPANFKFITIPYPRLWTQIGLAKQTFIDKLDVLFVPSHTLPLIRKPGLKTVITVHDLGAKYLPKMHQLKQQLYLKFMTDVQLKTATHIIAVSQATKNDIIHNIGIQPDKISVIYEGYNEKLFKPTKNKSLPYPYFLFVGTIQPRKNLERLIKAYTQFLRGVTASGVPHRAPAAKLLRARMSDGAASRQTPEQAPYLVLAGNRGWMSEEIYELPKKLGIEKYVKFLGYVPDEKLPALYSGAQALLFPSLFEGFGLPILEAMACGCPVLTSNISSMPEVAGRAAILVDPYSIEDIAKGILELSTNHRLRATLTKEGFLQAKKFSWEKAAQETLKILEDRI